MNSVHSHMHSYVMYHCSFFSRAFIYGYITYALICYVCFIYILNKKKVRINSRYFPGKPDYYFRNKLKEKQKGYLKMNVKVMFVFEILKSLAKIILG